MELTEYFAKGLRLETDRLVLRRISPSDASDMYEYACRPETSKYLLWEPHPYFSYTQELTRFLQREYAEGRFFDLAIIWRESGKMIGTVGFTSYDPKNSCAEAGYVISPDFWGKGIATEALDALLNFAFLELELNRVEAKYIHENQISLRVMEKCGMHREGVMRQKLLVKGVFCDIGIAAILRSEYIAAGRQNLYRQEKAGLLHRIFHKN